MEQNFQTVKYKKINFLKNSSKTGGAQNQVISSLSENEKIIHIHSRKHGRMWGKTNEDQLLKLVHKNIGLHEVLHGYPKKMYFDFDGKPDEKTSVETVKELIVEYFPEAEMAISGYVNDERVSYHIVLNNYVIENDEQLQDVKAIVKFMSTIDTGFDWKVYTKNRFMKAVNQSKVGKTPSKIIEDDDVKHHLITCFIPKTFKQLPKIEKPEIEEIQFREKVPFDWSTIKQFETKEPQNIDKTVPLELLKITPLDSSMNHHYTHKVARFCYHNGISCDDFLSWYMKKSTNERSLKKWRNNHWNRLESFPVITIENYLKNVLEHVYPGISQDSKLTEFLSLWNIDQECKKTDYLTVKDMKTKKKCMILNLGMGCGKTTQTINYLKEASNFCWITPNISLADNTHERIKQSGIKDCFLYNSARNKQQKQEKITNSNSVMVCLNSLFYISKNYEVVVIDEIETLLKLWFDNSTIKNLDDCWEKFIKLLKNAKKILLLDAFISKMTTNFLDSLNIDYQIVQKNNETSDRKATILPSMKHFYHNIVKDLKKDKKLLIFYPFKNQRKNMPSMKQLTETLEKLTGKRGIYHNAEADTSANNKLKDVNNSWQFYDFVISNNKINVGINFDVSYFHKCYLSIAGFNSPRDIIQFSYRARDLIDNEIIFTFIDKVNMFNSWAVQKVNTSNDIFQTLGDMIFMERTAPIVETFDFFLRRANYQINDKTIYEKIDNAVKFPDNDFYKYNNIKNIKSSEVETLQRDYIDCLTTSEKLCIKKFYFRKQFTKDISDEQLAILWDKNKFNFITKIRSVMTNDNHILHRLQQNYKWSMLFPDSIDQSFKISKEDLQLIFDTHKFKNLTEKSKHHLIMKNYINTIFGSQIIKTKTTDKKHFTFHICEKEKEMFLMVNKFIKIYNNTISDEDIDFVD